MSSNPPHRLLLIEPSEHTAAPIRALLEQNQFVVDVVSSTAEARSADLPRYAVLVVDVNPDDLEFVHWLHQTQSHLTGRVVVMSAHEGEPLTRELERLGVCDIVPKPINAQEILRAVFECLEPSPDFAVH